jgi:hypothetical protein
MTNDLDLPILKVGTAFTELRITGGPFLKPSIRGYMPCLRVTVTKSGLDYALIVGSKSLTEALEPLRKIHGGFVGLTVAIKKQSDEKMSPFIVSQDGK